LVLVCIKPPLPSGVWALNGHPNQHVAIVHADIANHGEYLRGLLDNYDAALMEAAGAGGG
jgi:hypothetical protein